MTIKDQILAFIQENKLTTEDVTDAMGRKGWVKDLLPMNPGQYVVGESYFIYTYDSTNWHVHDQVRNVPEGSVAVVVPFDCEDSAVIGHVTTTYLFKTRKAKGLVVLGRMRDVAAIRRDEHKVWASGVSPKGFHKIPTVIPPQTQEFIDKVRQIYEGSILVMDDSGVVMVSKQDQTPELLSALTKIRDREVEWYLKLDQGFSSFDLITGA
jgi:regulator of RNase E activity RraA